MVGRVWNKDRLNAAQTKDIFDMLLIKHEWDLFTQRYQKVKYTIKYMSSISKLIKVYTIKDIGTSEKDFRLIRDLIYFIIIFKIHK